MGDNSMPIISKGPILIITKVLESYHLLWRNLLSFQRLLLVTRDAHTIFYFVITLRRVKLMQHGAPITFQS